MIRPLLLTLLLLAAPARAQDMAGAAGEAARRLEEAAALLRQAGDAEDRLAALTRTVRAYEEGLGLMRDALRRVAAERRRIEPSFRATGRPPPASSARCSPSAPRPRRRSSSTPMARSPPPGRA
jgi:hypothetical protein